MTMASPLPRARPDLVFSRQELRDGVAYVVKDPVAGQYFCFHEAEHFILRQLDGATSPEAVRRTVETRFGARLEPEMLADFLRTLRQHGLLDGAPRKRRGGGPKGGPLSMRFKAFDPDRLLERLLRVTGFLFTPAFVAMSLLAILAGAYVALGNVSPILHELRGLLTVRGLASAWLVIVAVGMLHELAHGLTCKRFGGHVPEIGFLLLFFQPALYCNVSDAWLFAKKSQRLWVTLAGSYFELFLWALSVLVWRITDPGNVPHQIALVVAATSGVKTLFNFNPLLKLDGYYLLSDLLEVPNLRRKSFEHVGATIRSWFGSMEPTLVETPPRERRIYRTYGTLAVVFSFLFFGWLVLRLGAQFLGRYQLLGLVPFVLLVWWSARARRSGLARRRATTLASTALVAAPVVSPVPATAGVARPRVLRRLAHAAAWLVVLGIAVAAMLAPVDLHVAGAFTVSPGRVADVTARTEGFIGTVRVHEGQRVHAGDAIATISDRSSANDLDKLRIQIDQQRSAIDFARANERRYAALVQAEVASQVEYEQTQRQLRAAEGEMARLQTEQHYLASELREETVTSPIDGVVATQDRVLASLRDRYVRRGDPIVEIDDVASVRAEIAVPEKEIADVRAGQPLVLQARAYPGIRFPGRVESIGSVARDPVTVVAASAMPAPDVRQITVATTVENAAGLLKPSMTGIAKIECARVRAWELLARRLQRLVRVEVWSWW
jgi:putative peptide zinc metalloprotease protein